MSDDLPDWIKGTAFWLTHRTIPSEYYYNSLDNQPQPIEFINYVWYLLHYSMTLWQFGLQASYIIAHQNAYGLGYWDKTDPGHPNYQPPMTTIAVTIASSVATALAE